MGLIQFIYYTSYSITDILSANSSVHITSENNVTILTWIFTLVYIHPDVMNGHLLSNLLLVLVQTHYSVSVWPF